jgi:hypothetical protein
MLVRDEREIRLVNLMEQALIIDSTSDKMDLVKKYQGKNNSITIHLYAISPNALIDTFSPFKVTFLEKNNVDILPINETDMA